MKKIQLKSIDSIVDGKQISFVAPCGSGEAECLTINGVDYMVCDAKDNNMAGIDGIWASGAIVSVIINTVTCKAYIQNPASSGLTEELENQIRVDHSRLDELVAMRGENNELEIPFDIPSDAGSDFEYKARGTICSNGTGVVLNFYVAVDLEPGQSTSFDFIDGKFTPLSGGLDFDAADGSDLHITMFGSHSGGDTHLSLTAGSSRLYGNYHCYVEYNLLYVNIPELADLRVAPDGIAYPTAGEAIRGAFEGIEKRIEDLENNESGGNGDTNTVDTLVVKITLDGISGISSHTASQILEAFSDGTIVRASIDGESCHLALLSVNSGYAVFCQFADDNSWQKYLVTDTGDVEYYSEYYALDFNDSEIGSKGWSSKRTVDTLGPALQESGAAVRCQPIEGYPLRVITKISEAESGVTKLTLLQYGKNLYDCKKYPFHPTQAIQHKSGNTVTSEGYNGVTTHMPVGHLKGATITLNHPPLEKTNSTGIGLAFYDSSKTFITNFGGMGYTHVVPNNAEYMCFSVPREWYDGTRGTPEDIQIELGSKVTAFEPYRDPVQYVVESPEFIDGSYEWSGIKAINGVNSICVGVGTTSVEGVDEPDVHLDRRFKDAIDKCCPQFTESGTIVTCRPVEGYPLSVKAAATATIVTRGGKNLLDYAQAQPRNQNTVIKLIDNGVSWEAGSFYFSIPCNVKAGTTVAFNCSASGGSIEYASLRDAESGEQNAKVNPGGSVTVTKDVNSVCIYKTDANTAIETPIVVKNIQLEYGTVATAYEPYQQPETFDIGEAIPALSGTNVLFANSGDIAVTGRANASEIISDLSSKVEALSATVKALLEG